MLDVDIASQFVTVLRRRCSAIFDLYGTVLLMCLGKFAHRLRMLESSIVQGAETMSL